MCPARLARVTPRSVRGPPGNGRSAGTFKTRGRSRRGPCSTPASDEVDSVFSLPRYRTRAHRRRESCPGTNRRVARVAAVTSTTGVSEKPIARRAPRASPASTARPPAAGSFARTRPATGAPAPSARPTGIRRSRVTSLPGLIIAPRSVADCARALARAPDAGSRRRAPPASGGSPPRRQARGPATPGCGRPVQRHHITRRPVAMQRRRARVDMREHR